jgi:hypothetical protein
MVSCSPEYFLPTALHGFACRISIAAQILDGPPGFITRRPSTFMLIPVGMNRQGFAVWSAHLQQIRKCCDRRPQSGERRLDRHVSASPNAITNENDRMIAKTISTRKAVRFVAKH